MSLLQAGVAGGVCRGLSVAAAAPAVDAGGPGAHVPVAVGGAHARLPPRAAGEGGRRRHGRAGHAQERHLRGRRQHRGPTARGPHPAAAQRGAALPGPPGRAGHARARGRHPHRQRQRRGRQRRRAARGAVLPVPHPRAADALRPELVGLGLLLRGHGSHRQAAGAELHRHGQFRGQVPAQEPARRLPPAHRTAQVQHVRPGQLQSRRIDLLAG